MAEQEVAEIPFDSPLQAYHRPHPGAPSPTPLVLDRSSHHSRDKVVTILKEMKLWSPEIAEREVAWFYGRLGIHETYFNLTAPEDIARHIMSLTAAKILKSTSSDRLNLHIEREHADRAMFVVPSHGGTKKPTKEQSLLDLSDGTLVQHAKDRRLENYLEAQYLNLGYKGVRANPSRPPAKVPFRMQVFRTEGVVGDTADDNTHLRLYFLQAPEFPAGEVDPTESDINKVADKTFLAQVTDYTKGLYQDLMSKAMNQLHPAFVVKDTPKEHQKRLVVCFRSGTTHSLLSAMSDLYHYYQVRSSHKYVEPFKNGMVILSVYLCSSFHWHTHEHHVSSTDSPNLPARELTNFQTAMEQILRQASMTFVLPRSALSGLLQSHVFSLEQVSYAYAAWKFAHQFLRRYGDEQVALAKILAGQPEHAGLLSKLKTRLHKEVYTETQLLSAIKDYPEVMSRLYQSFAHSHCPAVPGDPLNKVNPKPGFDEAELREFIRKNVPADFDRHIFYCLVEFNKHILKTNFFSPKKVALAFRLAPGFLSAQDLPALPFGIFFIVGSEFLGFHVRFADVARGGIRVIRSANNEVYRHNASTLFDENYNLAFTQQKKNKDIPEGGSKGTILLSAEHQDKAKVCFKKYADSVLDLLLLDEEDDIVDHYGEQEILFLGPDEGTADFMDWAAMHARKRGAKFWKAFTTGKSTSIGGIPHDLYGMTTRSVHQYVVGTLGKLDIDEETIHKLQTGGPDGDLGSNEILISQDKTTTIIDGSGVLHDPAGINRDELVRLAKARVMIDQFDTKLLSETGFRVLVQDREITLPDGEIVESGLVFRNQFHLNARASADLFVPCGGRPKAVNAANVDALLDEEGRPRFRVVVEGANLFFTQEARLVLEKKGVILFKDASANKGGVTSSSLEVLAALALSDEQFEEHMTVKADGTVPPLRAEYVKEVQDIIEENARREFECIWMEHERTGSPRSVLTDKISLKINDLNSSIITSTLWSKQQLREIVFREFVPKTLFKLVDFDTFMKRVPPNYLSAIFGSYLAGRFVYKFGIDPPDFAFFEFVELLSAPSTNEE